jgi:hypothetical protein
MSRDCRTDLLKRLDKDLASSCGVESSEIIGRGRDGAKHYKRDKESWHLVTIVCEL